MIRSIERSNTRRTNTEEKERSSAHLSLSLSLSLKLDTLKKGGQSGNRKTVISLYPCQEGGRRRREKKAEFNERNIQTKELTHAHAHDRPIDRRIRGRGLSKKRQKGSQVDEAPIHPSTHPFIHPSVHPSIHPSRTIRPSIHPPIYP